MPNPSRQKENPFAVSLTSSAPSWCSTDAALSTGMPSHHHIEREGRGSVHAPYPARRAEALPAPPRQSAMYCSAYSMRPPYADLKIVPQDPTITRRNTELNRLASAAHSTSLDGRPIGGSAWMEPSPRRSPNQVEHRPAMRAPTEAAQPTHARTHRNAARTAGTAAESVSVSDEVTTLASSFCLVHTAYRSSFRRGTLVAVR